MSNTQPSINLRTANLFNVSELYHRLIDENYYLFLDRNSYQNSWGTSTATFSLYYAEDLKDTMHGQELPMHLEYAFTDCPLQQVSITDIMDYVIKEDILKDEDFINAWKEHLEWHTTLADKLYAASSADFPYPESYSDSLYVYSDISSIQRFANLLISVTEVTFHGHAIAEQEKIINEILPFVVDELIPITIYGTDEVSVETIDSLMSKIHVYLTKLFWIYTL
ncbi:MAG: hypothetical protein UEA60_09945 [Lachnospiraceae bacterium]|nr:hypothetical protein [Lachnospiraceae bacterium]